MNRRGFLGRMTMAFMGAQLAAAGIDLPRQRERIEVVPEMPEGYTRYSKGFEFTQDRWCPEDKIFLFSSRGASAIGPWFYEMGELTAAMPRTTARIIL
jgi:hypothetical protein